MDISKEFIKSKLDELASNSSTNFVVKEATGNYIIHKKIDTKYLVNNFGMSKIKNLVKLLKNKGFTVIRDNNVYIVNYNGISKPGVSECIPTRIKHKFARCLMYLTGDPEIDTYSYPQIASIDIDMIITNHKNSITTMLSQLTYQNALLTENYNRLISQYDAISHSYSSIVHSLELMNN